MNSSSPRPGSSDVPEVRALDAGVHDGARRLAARDVHELRRGVVAVPVQLLRGRTVDAGSVAGHEITVRDVVAVEVDRTLMSGGQVETGRMTAQQLSIPLIRNTRGWIGGEELREPRILREVGLGRGGTGAHQHERRETTDRERATRHDHRIARIGLNRQGPGFYRGGRRAQTGTRPPESRRRARSRTHPPESRRRGTVPYTPPESRRKARSRTHPPQSWRRGAARYPSTATEVQS